MTDTTQLTTTPKYRKQLNSEQLKVLNNLYVFRFLTSKQLANYLGKKSRKDVQMRLRILEDQGFIAKRYDKSYKLKGQPAAYYLLPEGARTFARLSNRSPETPVKVKAIYKDKDVSEHFIAHCMHIFDVFLQVRSHYLGKIEFFSRSHLNYEQFNYFPQPLPDGYIRLKIGNGIKRVFLDIFEDDQPFFVLIRRIKKYLEYADDGEWPYSETIPTILLVTDNKSMHKRLRKRIAYELRESYQTEARFATTTLQDLQDSTEDKGKVWLPIDEHGDDKDDPTKPVTLSTLLLNRQPRIKG